MKIQILTVMVTNSFNFQQNEHSPLILTELTEQNKKTTTYGTG